MAVPPKTKNLAVAPQHAPFPIMRLTAAAYAECPKCGEPKRPHRMSAVPAVIIPTAKS